MIAKKRNRYTLQNDYFHKMDHVDKFYWYGFIFADGYNGKHFGIELQKRDIEILKKFQKDIQHTGKLYESKKIRNGKEYYYTRISIVNSEFSQCLTNIGIVPHNKTLIDMSDEQFRHFLRGFSDGDGCIYISKPTNKTGRKIASWSATIHNDIMPKIRDRIENITKIHLTTCKHWRSSHVSTISVNGNKNTFTFLKWLYSNSKLHLKRKYAKFQKLEKYFRHKLNYKSTSSKYRGVYFCKTKKKYVTDIRYHGKAIHLGAFESEKEAALAYNKIAQELLGMKAILNDVSLP